MLKSSTSPPVHARGPSVHRIGGPWGLLILLLASVVAVTILLVLPRSSRTPQDSSALLLSGTSSANQHVHDRDRSWTLPLLPWGAPAPPKLAVCPKSLFRDIALSDDHGYTNRGFEQHVPIHPPFWNLTHMFAQKQTPKILEIGSGVGHALLDLQASFPRAQLYGTNYAKYEYPQASNSSGLLAAAKRYNITVYCDPDHQNRPVLPTIFLMPSIVDPEADLTAIFNPQSLDFVISVHALNNKLQATDSHKYIPKIMEMLAPGAIAVIHAGDLTKIKELSGGPFLTTHSWTVTHPRTRARYSVLLYIVADREFSKSTDAVGLAVRRCTPSDVLNRDGDCIVPDSMCERLRTNVTKLFAQAQQAMNVSDPANDGRQTWAHNYRIQTWTNIIEHMDRWDDMVADLNEIKN